jgi:hypothetical protein
MKHTILFGLICSALFGICGFCGDTPTATAPPIVSSLTAQFAVSALPPDTLHFFISEAGDGPAIPDSLLKLSLDSAQFEQLHFGTGEAQFRQLGRYSFNETLDALLIGTEEFWFGKQTLVLTDKKTGKVAGLLEVSNFYGGDGGQTASESWWFRTSNPPRIYVKTAQHGFKMQPDGDPLEYYQEEGQLLEWQQNTFKPIPQPDSLVFLKNFPMYRVW